MIVADDGCRFWTRTTGSGSRVICVHGGPGWWNVLDELAAILAKNATVHQWDQRGSGAALSLVGSARAVRRGHPHFPEVVGDRAEGEEAATGAG
jgi:pimeloyl-ACP methyl ester carboxylesterase